MLTSRDVSRFRCEIDTIFNTLTKRLDQWQALLLYCDHGIAEIDDNAAERALRSVALGRKNFLFMGADSGGERAVAMYALIGTAKLNGIDPEVYLRHVFTYIADHPINQIAELLPWAVQAQLVVITPETDFINGSWRQDGLRELSITHIFLWRD